MTLKTDANRQVVRGVLARATLRTDMGKLGVVIGNTNMLVEEILYGIEVPYSIVDTWTITSRNNWKERVYWAWALLFCWPRGR